MKDDLTMKDDFAMEVAKLVESFGPLWNQPPITTHFTSRSLPLVTRPSRDDVFGR